MPEVTGSPAQPFVYRHRVRFRDCDPQGRVFSANYIGFIDDAVTELWREHLGGYQSIVEQGVDFVVAEVGIRYRRPAEADDLLDVQLAIDALDATSMVVEFLIAREDVRIAAGELHYVFIDTVNHRRTAVPPSVRDALDLLVAP